MEKEAEEKKKEEARKKSSKGNQFIHRSPQVPTPVTNQVINDQMEEMLEEFGG